MLQSGKSATMLPSIAASSSGHWNQDGSRRWQRSISPSAPMRTATSTSPRKPSTSASPSRAPPDLARSVCSLPVGQPLENLIDQLQALLDLADADPHPRIDVAVVAHRHLELKLVIGRIGHCLARIEGAARGASDIAAGAEGAGKRRREIAGGDGAVLERGGVVVDLDQPGKLVRTVSSSARRASMPPSPRSSVTPPGTMRSIISR